MQYDAGKDPSAEIEKVMSGAAPTKAVAAPAAAAPPFMTASISADGSLPASYCISH